MTSSTILRRKWRRSIATILAALAFATLVPTTAHAASTESEPNNSRSTANRLTTSETISGSSLVDDYWDHDYYGIDLPKAGRVTLNLKFPANLGTGRAYWVHVYNSAGNKLYRFDVQANDSDGRKLAAMGTFAPAGRLYIDIEGYHRDVTWGKTYTLNVGFAAGNVEEEFNDSTRSANPIAIGTTVSGSSLGDDYWDHDYYAIDLPKAGRVTLNLKFPANLGTDRAYWVHVYNSAGDRLYRFDVSATPASTSPSITLPQGRSYIDIEGYHRDVTWGKTYTLTVTRPPSTLTQTPTPTITGTAAVGSTLTANAGTWAPAPVTLSYQWLRDGKAIVGGTKSSYALVAADAGKKISLKVTGSKAGYTTVSKTSATKTIALRTLTAATPTLSGTAKVGSTLTAKAGAWAPAPVTLKYQWLRNGKAIAKATKSSYKLSKSDKGKNISVKVTGSKPGYQTVSKTSTAKKIK